MKPKGKLLIIGGKEDRDGDKPEIENKTIIFHPTKFLNCW
jgi:hypothetical protein